MSYRVFLDELCLREWFNGPTVAGTRSLWREECREKSVLTQNSSASSEKGLPCVAARHSRHAVSVRESGVPACGLVGTEGQIT